MEKTTIVLLGFLLLAAPIAVQAQFTYTTNADNTLTITGYSGPPWAVTIPTNINSRTVSTIGELAFYIYTNLTSVIIPDSVTTIENGAFIQCTALTNVTIPNGVSYIGAGTFEECASLTNVMIPASVISIDDAAFAFCANLNAITVDLQNPFYSSTNGVLFDKSESTLIQFPGKLGGNYTVPGSVTSIGVVAFAGSAVTSVTIPSSVTNMGPSVFELCNSLTNATIPKGVTNMEYEMFTYCPNLISVYFYGNAPTVVMDPYFGPTVFEGDTNATVCYLPGTTGWSNTLPVFRRCSWRHSVT